MNNEESDLNKRIGNFIRKNRMTKGLTETELARRMMLSQQHISRCEHGKCSFNLVHVCRFLNILDKSFSDFIQEVLYGYDDVKL
ncbi:helix-turn-helix domain-containing protein [Proteus myxofaciens]|uniref:HTH cro/C1-type domain-containing protein n=1 Tax=Proteus myxofaciens ATCC 19692 TaxID=1354337 RepID=A0A198FW11_9GAMM|nr:helix-turn-helix transcriptional regulator [Proteus myxofaciens]OAT28664.1 hypothetical protein M983_1720 [Proteus myxofaciens ATCC 19692]